MRTNIPEYRLYFTAKDGAQAEIFGDSTALDAIERAFAKAGIHFNTEVETWDEGYYSRKPNTSEQRS